jgi:hypothetical protein
MLLAAIGMRAGEALSIRVKDVDFDSNPSKLSLCMEYTITNVFDLLSQYSHWEGYRTTVVGTITRYNCNCLLELIE